MAGGYMGAYQGGVNNDYLQQLLNAQRAGVPFSNSDAYLQQVQAQPTTPQPQATSPAPLRTGGPDVQPAPTGGGAATGGGGAAGGGGGTLSDLRAMILGYNPDDKINAAFDLQTKQGLTDMGMSYEDQMAARGVDPGSATGQDLKSRLTAQILGPLAAARASALANAQGDRLSRLTQLSGMELDANRQSQQDAFLRQRYAADDAYRNSQLAMQQREADQAANRYQADATWRQQQEAWAREDRNRQNQMLAQQGSTGGSAMSGMSPEAQRARDLILGGSGGRSATEILGGGGGSERPTTSTGHPMGGGTGLSGLTSGTSFGKPFGGFTGGHKWDGVDRSVGYNNGQPKPFEGANTTTVGAAVNGPTTSGTGTSWKAPATNPGTPGLWNQRR